MYGGFPHFKVTYLCFGAICFPRVIEAEDCKMYSKNSQNYLQLADKMDFVFKFCIRNGILNFLKVWNNPFLTFLFKKKLFLMTGASVSYSGIHPTL